MTRRFTNVDSQHVDTNMQEVFYRNDLLGINATMTFFYQWFRIRIPSRVPAGQVAIVVETDCENNFHYFPSREWVAY